MYAGTTISHGSGRIVGVHQKINRIARRRLKRHIPDVVDFPNIKTILHFEGKNGPDGIKRKSPSVDEPWHFIDPKNPDDKAVLTSINNHSYNLSIALRSGDKIKAAFEAAWLAHAIVDGLTPAHHYPMGEKIKELWGKDHDQRSSVKEKGIIKGVNSRDTISKNWQYWGAGGVITKHFNFEMGVASAISTDKFKEVEVTSSDIDELRQKGFEQLYLESVNKIYSLKMYDNLIKKGWTHKLALQTKKYLIPEMIRMVTLAWYQASLESIEVKNEC